MNKPIVLCILDGFGNNSDNRFNAVTAAKTPFLDSLYEKYPHTNLRASGTAVGLPGDTMGNSEVGHITIGSGRILPQYLERFKTTDWDKNSALAEFIAKLKKSGGTAHIVGLMSDGLVHSDIQNTLMIAKQVLKQGLKIAIHFISDGRDVNPKSAEKYIKEIESELKSEFESGKAFFATLSGRYWAMDRNNNMDRTSKAVNAIAKSQSDVYADDILAGLNTAYDNNQTDEFIEPVVITKSPITSNDGIIFANHRGDRARQILRELIKTGANVLSFAQYGEDLNDLCPALLNDIEIKNTLGTVLSQNNKTQLRIAETEKYNHVTYFFDGEKNEDLIGMDKILKPEMSANEITDKLLQNINKYDVVILNYANGDMVGHTAKMDAAVIAVETLDKQLSKIVPAVLEIDGVILITADHGNVEQLWDFETGTPWTAHTNNTVPFIVVSNKYNVVASGGLSDIAPTMLKMLDIEKPEDMTGKNLVAE